MVGMRVDTENLLAMIAGAKRELTDALRGLDEAIADCQGAHRELTQTLSIIERVEWGP
jgi:hypothetical protein